MSTREGNRKAQKLSPLVKRKKTEKYGGITIHCMMVWVLINNRELNDSRMRKSEVTVERVSVCDVVEKLMQHGIHCLPCSYTNDLIYLLISK